MLEKVPSLSLDQIVNQSKDQRLALTIPLHRIYRWWKNRNKVELEETHDCGEYSCGTNSFARPDKIDQRIDAAIARANGDRYREG